MPNRILKESICASESLEQLNDPACEVLFFRLIVNCDDFGRFDGRAAVVRSSCFKLSSNSISLADVEDRLQSLVAADLIQLYVVDGRRYLYFPTWDKHQSRRAKKSKWPNPPAQQCKHEPTPPLASICEQVQADASKCLQVLASANICDPLLANVPVFVFEERERGTRNEKERTNTCASTGVNARESDSSSETPKPEEPRKPFKSLRQQGYFNRFWQAYPRKRGKGQAEKAWCNLQPSPNETLLETMLAALACARDSPDWHKDGGQFIPHPATWLNGKRWEDDCAPVAGRWDNTRPAHEVEAEEAKRRAEKAKNQRPHT